MASFYNKKQLKALSRGLGIIHEHHTELQDRVLSFKFKTEFAIEHARHGYLRRLATLLRAVEIVFELLPPELEGRAERQSAVDAAIAIHSFVVNTFGALDNLAWILVAERNVRAKNGRELHRNAVSLANEQIRQACSPIFRNYLERREAWNAGMRDFRDSLAHRIPLYIPEYMISRADGTKYAALEKAIMESIWTRKRDEYRKLKREQEELGRFQPLMVHSFTEQKGGIWFHFQLIADLRTVHEHGRKTLVELKRKKF